MASSRDTSTSNGETNSSFYLIAVWASVFVLLLMPLGAFEHIEMLSHALRLQFVYRNEMKQHSSRCFDSVMPLNNTIYERFMRNTLSFVVRALISATFNRLDKKKCTLVDEALVILSNLLSSYFFLLSIRFGVILVDCANSLSSVRLFRASLYFLFAPICSFCFCELVADFVCRLKTFSIYRHAFFLLVIKYLSMRRVVCRWKNENLHDRKIVFHLWQRKKLIFLLVCC